MAASTEVKTVALIGDYVPRRCGIATFTHDVHASVASQFPEIDCFVVPVNDTAEGYDYPPEVRFEIAEHDLSSYRRAADFLNFSNTHVVCVQHEYGIYGGHSGSHILGLLRELRMPIVSTLHTVLKDPDDDQRRVLTQLCDLSARVIVMTERGKQFLQNGYGVTPDKIDVIPHGIPEMPFVDPNFHKDRLGAEGKNVLLTFGLLSPSKGIEHMLQAMPSIVKACPDTVYIVLGATHPNLLREQGERYRISLDRMARDLGIRKNVSFYNRFVDLKELTEFLGAADVYVTPYLNAAQIVSGTLAYAFGCGKAVVSTPYWHAEELLADGRGILVPFADPAALSREIVGLLTDETRRHAMRKRAYLLGQDMMWPRVAHQFVDSFRRARQFKVETAPAPAAVHTLGERAVELPDWRLDHLFRLTDRTGMLQHATFTIPNAAEGYCTDDNARALLLTVLLEELGLDYPSLNQATTTYAAFLQHALHPDSGRFRNFMGFDRRWLEDAGSTDSHGRAVWALGATVGRSGRRELQCWASHLLTLSHGPVVDFTAPRSWAFALLGLHEYLRRLQGDRRVSQAAETLTTKLVDLYDATATDEWPWFEPELTYDNARLCEALIVAGAATSNDKAQTIGLQALRWLIDLQKAPNGHLRPIGSNGFYRRGAEQPAAFDQQPVEVAATVAACLAAHRATEDDAWLWDARAAFEWFLGRNDLGLELYDPTTGGCRDGLQSDRVNENQGAESTLAFLLALAEMKLSERTLAAFNGTLNGDVAAYTLFAR